MENSIVTLSGFYKKSILYPSIVSVITTSIFSIIDNANYKSEWVTSGTVIGTSIVITIALCFLIALLSLTIFLNSFNWIKKTFILNFLSWFFVPFGFIGVIIIHEILFEIKFDHHLSKDLLYIFLPVAPFIFGLTWSFKKYRRLAFTRKPVSNQAFYNSVH